MNLKAIIVEDETHSLETLKNLLEKFCEGVEVIGLASSVKEALEVIQKSQPDVVFMDIELQSGTGFDILTQLPEINFEVIFTTAFDQYAIKAVKFSSLDYLLKPIDLEELQQAVEKAKQAKNRVEYNQQLKTLLQNINQPKLSKICLATADGFEFISTSEILYCEAGGSYTTFVLINGKKLLVSKHLKEYENMLADQHFMRVHNSYLINLKEVKKYVKADGGYIVMNNEDIVSISRGKKDTFIEAMQRML
tara:strand:+ start:209931 stop:210680 length:750 start_codon:yes stop_codon:yes gene_type:complete